MEKPLLSLPDLRGAFLKAREQFANACAEVAENRGASPGLKSLLALISGTGNPHCSYISLAESKSIFRQARGPIARALHALARISWHAKDFTTFRDELGNDIDLVLTSPCMVRHLFKLSLTRLHVACCQQELA